MRVKRILLSYVLLDFGISSWPQRGNGTLSSSSEGVTLSEAEWTGVQARFENDITVLIDWFETYKTRKKVLAGEILELQDKSAQLRDQSNFFKEIHLKELLNKLRDKLEENSDLDHEADLKQKEFEEKKKNLSIFPCVAILGPRQVGKTHISREFKFNYYFDLFKSFTYKAIM